MAWLNPEDIQRMQNGMISFSRSPRPDLPPRGIADLGILPVVLTGLDALGTAMVAKKVIDWVAPSAEPSVRIIQIRDGAEGTDDTVKVMSDLAFAAAHDPAFVMWVQNLVRGAASKDYETEMQIIFSWVQSNVRYVNDPRGLEWVQDPRVTAWGRKSGDCDDISALIAAMSLALGHGAMFRTYKVDPTRPDEYSHVIGLVGYRNPRNGEPRWIAMDATQLDGYPGWEPPAVRVIGQKTWMLADA